MLKVSQMFTSNMVLQREKNIAVFGTGRNDSRVTVGLNGKVRSALIKDGKWKVILPPMKAADGLEMTVSDGTDTQVFTNVALGEVWLLGGQSNMEFELQNAKDGDKYLEELTEDTPIRYYYMPKVNNAEDAETEGAKTSWTCAGKEDSRAWSAVGYHFAAKLSRELGVTVGLIGCNWGGSSASCWVDRETLSNDKRLESYITDFEKGIEGKSLDTQEKEYKDYEKAIAQWDKDAEPLRRAEPDISWEKLEGQIGKCPWPGPINEYNPFRPGAMYENLLMRACPYTLRGFLYYQGESDDHKPDSYYRLMCSLIELWREKWGDDTLPFIMTQLPMFIYENTPDSKSWCRIRSAQMKTFRTVKNTGIAVITDCGEFNEIHPKDKLPVGERLCLQAEKLVYGMDVHAFGPVFRYATVSGSRMTLRFDNADDGFKVRSGAKEFEIAGSDGIFVPADALICGNTIVVSSPRINEPNYVRYNWSNYANCIIFGQNGIPLAPFSTFDE